MFCTTTSCVLWHKVYLGLPPKDELAAEVQEGITNCGSAIDIASESCSTPFEPWRVKSLRSSAIFRRAFGPIIGRIRIAFPSRVNIGDCRTSVPLSLAREVIAKLIERRNGALRDAFFAHPHLPAHAGVSVFDRLEYGSEEVLDLVA